MLKKTNRTVQIAGVPREIWVMSDGREFVEQDGDFITVAGAKTFKTATSRGYPLPAGADILAAEFREGPAFVTLSDDEQRKKLEKFFLGVLECNQELERGTS